MCTIEEGFKLCSCDKKLDLDQDGVYWFLQRMDASKPLEKRMGKCIIPRYDKKEEVSRHIILNALNERNCFDFPFEANKNDFLKIQIQEKDYSKKFCFQYSGKEWILDSCDHLQSWKSQLSPFKSGKVEPKS